MPARDVDAAQVRDRARVLLDAVLAAAQRARTRGGARFDHRRRRDTNGTIGRPAAPEGCELFSRELHTIRIRRCDTLSP
jgi:hypothetical protein